MMDFSCHFCGRESTNVKNFLSHSRLHRNVKNFIFSCVYRNCNGKFTRFTSLKSHMSRNHSANSALYFYGSNMETCNFVCHIRECFKKIVGKKNLVAHLKTHISNGLSIQCPISGCQGNFSVKSSFSSHMSRKHRFFRNGDIETFASNINQNAGSSDVISQVSANNLELDNDGEESDDSDQVISNNEFKKTLGLALLKFETVNLIPISTIDDILSSIQHLHALSLSNLKQNLKVKCNDNDVPKIESSFAQDLLKKHLSNSEEEHLTSNFKRHAFYKENFQFVEPVEISLGLNARNKTSVFHYVPIKKTLDTLVSNKNVLHQLKNPREIETGSYTDVCDGESFQNNSYFIQNPNALKLILYQDAFEIVNPLGSAKKTFKLVGFYFTLADFYPQFRSKIDHLQLALLCKETDLEYFGNKVLEPLIRDIKELSNGVYLRNDIFLKANLLLMLGDNLGSHWIGGFITNFGNAEYFCRFCCISRESWLENQTFLAPARDKESYSKTVDKIDRKNLNHEKGIKSDCVFHILPGFHVCNPGLPPCLGHDVFEGILKYDLPLFLKEIVTKEKWVTVDKINHEIKHLALNGSESNNRPALLKSDFKCLKGHAVQNWTFLRILPILLGEYVIDVENPYWNTILLLREIIEYICSYKISLNQIGILQSLVSDYVERRKDLFPAIPLRPKHHYFLHYPQLITQFGPLMHVWTMRFESKHTYFKNIVRSSKNFINVTKTLAVKHQLLQAYYSEGNLFTLEASFDNVKDIDLSLFNEQIQTLIQNKFLDISGVQLASGFTLNGSQVKNQQVFVLNISDGIITFVRVEICIAFQGKPYVICKQYSSSRSNMGVYIVDFNTSRKFCLVLFNDLLDKFPLSVFSLEHNQVIALKHYPFDAMVYM